ncbi:ATP-binding protein [Salisaeta longa]|uniref:ATP-binding protein n=1 Tax=Salisaeta longa TaxID=503170 RepID=UPI001469B9FC|nr:ATP-binding protein [Salisaeta longa]
MSRFLLAAVGLVVVGFPLMGPSSRAQPPQQRYTVEDGLPNNHITALARTGNGLLWIGTADGLAVYDGHRFRSVALPAAISKDVVTALRPMPDGSVWAGIGHDAVQVRLQGVQRYVVLDEHSVTDIVVQNERLRFVTDFAVWTLPRGAGQPARTRFRYKTLRGVTNVWGAAVDTRQRLWILNSGEGLGRVSRAGRVSFVHPAIPDASEGAAEYGDLQICSGRRGWVVRGSQLLAFNAEAPAIRTLKEKAQGLPARATLACGEEGVYVFQGGAVAYYSHAHQTVQRVAALDAEPTALQRDANNHLWIGTRRGLVQHVGGGIRYIRSVEGTRIRTGTGFRTMGTALWANTWGEGLLQLRPTRRRVTPGGHIRWVFAHSAEEALHALASPRRDWYRWTPDAGWVRQGVARGAVRGYVDSAGVGYFWHNNGLYRHVPTADTVRGLRLRAWSVDDSQHHLMGPSPTGDIILFDEGYLLRLQRPDGAVVDTLAWVPEHATSQGRRLHVDSAGRIWCPFRGSGVLRVDPSTGTAETLLEGTVVEKMTAAGDSLIMANTNNGLYVMDPATGAVVRHLTRADGLLANDVNGSRLLRDTLYVGHQTGVTLIPYQRFARYPARPTALLTGLEVGLHNRPLAASETLAVGDRTIGFSYTGVSLAYAHRVQYEVRLMPRDTTWRATQRSFTRFTDLPPGTYRFQVRARLGHRAAGPVASYVFTMPPHLYERWWVQGVIVLLLLGVALGGYRWRIRRYERRQTHLRRVVEERTRELAYEKEKTEAQAERLAALDEAKNRFFAYISHEFRTPLTLILNPLRDAFRAATHETATLPVKELRPIIDNAYRLERLVDQLLDLAKLDADEMTLDCQVVDVASLVARTAEAFASMAERQSIDLQVHQPSEAVPASVDVDKIEKIVTNLLSNALKYTPEGGRITVHVAREMHGAEPRVQLKVADTGPGIAPEAQHHIFERFAQAHASAADPPAGTGLGLTLCKQLVALHGGQIAVESTPGHGATFTVELPVEVSPDAACEDVAPALDAPAPHVAERPAAGDGAAESAAERILVVEDNAEMRAYLRDKLANQWEVRVAEGGAEGWSAVQDQPPALVLSDVMMPTFDGFELCRRIKADDDLRTIPVLLLTARASTDATVEGLSCGADDYIQKPFDIEELRQRIANHLAARAHLEAQYRSEVKVGATVVDAQDAPFAEQLLETINKHISNPDLTVGQLAEETALSRRQFTRRVKEATGEPPATFLRTYRLEQAQQLLDQTPETVAEVAYAVGFKSTSSFSRSFRKATGLSPTEYMEQA